jgi:hypothetical protein
MSVTTIAEAKRNSLHQSCYDYQFAAIRERGISGGSQFRFVDTQEYGNLESGFIHRRNARMFVVMGEIDYASSPVR